MPPSVRIYVAAQPVDAQELRWAKMYGHGAESKIA